MAKRRFSPEDSYRLRAAIDPQLSPDGRRVAFVVGEVDQEADRMALSIWVAPTDGSSPPRPFSEGPSDTSPRWSPDGRWLAFISVADDKPLHAHVRLAPLDGGSPRPLGGLPGPVSQLAWSPGSSKLVVVCLTGGRDPDKESPAERNEPRTVSGLAQRLDGTGWRDGRRHLFVVDVDGGRATQITRGDYDHADPSFSPDGMSITFVSDRHARRDDRQFRSDAWVVPAAGGRLLRLTNTEGRVGFPLFSPDGSMVAFAGQEGEEVEAWDSDCHVYVVPADGSGQPERVAPETDRGVPLAPQLPNPFAWTGKRDIAMLVMDAGNIALHQARLNDRSSREILGGDTQIDGFSTVVGQRAVVFTASWVDRPTEVYASTVAGGAPCN